MIRPFIFVWVLAFLVAGVNFAGNPVVSAEDFLTRIRADVDSGVLDPEEALLIKFHHLFDRGRVPPRYQAEQFIPLKCATPLIQEFQALRRTLSPTTVSLIDGYLHLEPSRLSYLSPGGHFQLTYATTGENAVPAEDVNPANGIPDFVEKIASYFDQSWSSQVELHGFQNPPIGLGTYSVSFAQQESYGYTASVDAETGLTRIVMHPNYQGFPPNDDPDGSVWGAAKVTAAHEFKHATQYATSRWSEGGWIEVDAVWAEELVFDQVNDYYNYLPGESPIRHPEVSLDGGSTGTGSYEDCVWQLWLSQTWGVEIITAFWNWRVAHLGQSVMDSWSEILGAYGSSLIEGWAQFSVWNYGTDYRAVSGLGYTEAARYPAGASVASTSSLPFTYSGSVDHLAANFIRILGLDGSQAGTLALQFNGSSTTRALTVGIHLTRFDGTGAIETMNLDGNNDGSYSCQIPLQEIQGAGIVVGNANSSGPALSYELSVSQEEGQPEPGIELEVESFSWQVAAGQAGTSTLGLENSGAAGSQLQFEVQVWGNSPPESAEGKSISGSTLTVNTATYLPGASFDGEFTVFNGGNDEEWLTDVTLDFPVGVTVTSTSDFIGGSYGPLVSNQQSGNGAFVSWHGTVGAEAYGVIKEGESATAILGLTVDPGFQGDLEIQGTIVGDQYGANPHQLNQVITLIQASSEINLTYPNGGEGLSVVDPVFITWETLGGIAFVDVALSRDGGENWEAIAEELVNTGSLETILGGIGSTRALIRVGDSFGSVEDFSDDLFSLVENVSWLSVSPSSGTLEPGQSTNLALDFDSAGLVWGEHQVWLVINHNAPESPLVLPVTMTVTDPLSPSEIPGGVALNGIFPNPFNPTTHISFHLPEATQIWVDVLDLRGRVVCHLHSGVMDKGEKTLLWDGRDDGGKVLAAGLYLARLRTAGFEATVKMTLAK